MRRYERTVSAHNACHGAKAAAAPTTAQAMLQYLHRTTIAAPHVLHAAAARPLMFADPSIQHSDLSGLTKHSHMPHLRHQQHHCGHYPYEAFHASYTAAICPQHLYNTGGWHKLHLQCLHTNVHSAEETTKVPSSVHWQATGRQEPHCSSRPSNSLSHHHINTDFVTQTESRPQ